MRREVKPMAIFALIFSRSDYPRVPPCTFVAVLLGIFCACGHAEEVKAANVRLTMSVSVRDFGAKGDGVTDDSHAIQSAIDSLSNGGTVFLPEGIYLLRSSIKLRHGVNLVGAGCGQRGRYGGATQIRTDRRIAIITADDQRYIGIYNLELFSPTAHYGIRLFGTKRSVVENVVIHGGMNVGLALEAKGEPGDRHGTFFNTIRKVQVIGGRYGIRICTIDGKEHRINEANANWLYDCEVWGNGNSTIGLYMDWAYGNTIVNLLVQNCRYGIYLDQAVRETRFIGGYAESNKLATFYLDGSRDFLRNLWIFGFDSADKKDMAGRIEQSSRWYLIGSRRRHEIDGLEKLRFTLGADVDMNGARITRLRGISGARLPAANLGGACIVRSYVDASRVRFKNPEPDARYHVILTPEWCTRVWVTDKAKDGFTINVDPAPKQDSIVHWLIFRSGN